MTTPTAPQIPSPPKNSPRQHLNGMVAGVKDELNVAVWRVKAVVLTSKDMALAVLCGLAQMYLDKKKA